ncbi:hypothetical protein GGS21DRAFT_480774 [Xylaria nigripes]|nr:hypothetical protein GGS21DRAFT_480774 [Xylaria nigripes]
MSSRAVLGAACAGSNGAFEVVARRLAGQQQRTFTSTPQRHAQIVHFRPGSSPELEKLLATIRDKIILPSYLPMAQRKRLYSLKWQKKLQSDPIVMELDGEVIKFGYVDQQKEVYNTAREIIKVVSMFREPEDYENLGPLLEGIKHANRKIPQAKIVRMLGEQGRISLIIDCAHHADRTNFKLDTSEKVNEILHYLQLRARNDEEKTKQSLRWAEMVVDMLSTDNHRPRIAKREDLLPLNCDPMVLAAPLHLAAALVTQFDAGGEFLTKVRKFAQHIVAFWPAGKGLQELQPSELYNQVYKLKYLQDSNKFVALATPLLYGLEMAIEVVEPELATQLQTRHDILAAEIHKALKKVLDRSPRPLSSESSPSSDSSDDHLYRGQLVYEKYYGAKKNTKEVYAWELEMEETD